MAGDLAISVPTALRQAGEQGHALSAEIKVLILHGLLHLAGYDHETDSGRMARREQQLRTRLRLPRGLIERAAAKIARKRPSGAKQAAMELGKRVGLGRKSTAGAKALVHSGAFAARLKSCPDTKPSRLALRSSFPLAAASQARADAEGDAARLKPRPFKSEATTASRKGSAEAKRP